MEQCIYPSWVCFNNDSLVFRQEASFLWFGEGHRYSCEIDLEDIF